MKQALAPFLLSLSIVSPAAAAAMVAIDVGHYREQPGAISARGRPEFEFNLDLAREIESALKALGHATRLIGADGGVKDLWRRPRAAPGAALFVSVHHDSTQKKYQTTWLYGDTEQRYSDRFAGFSSFVSRENPAWRKALRCASAIGSPHHLAGELFKTMAGIRMIHVPYKGASPALVDVVAGHIEVYFGAFVSVLPHVRSGRLRALGVTSLKRVAVMPEIATIDEQGKAVAVSGARPE